MFNRSTPDKLVVSFYLKPVTRVLCVYSDYLIGFTVVKVCGYILPALKDVFTFLFTVRCVTSTCIATSI